MGKPCNRCNEPFNPTGKDCKICIPCQNKSFIIRKAHAATIVSINRIFLTIDNKIAVGALQAA